MYCFLIFLTVLALFPNAVATAQSEALPLPSSQSVPVTLDDPLWNAPPADPEDSGIPDFLAPPTPVETTFRDALVGVFQKPMDWFRPVHWDSSWQIGLNGSRGNADANSFRTGLDLTRESYNANWDINLVYAKNESDGVETQHNALVYSIHDWKIAFPGWSINTKSGLEYDEFKNFDIRYWANTGLGYRLIESPITEFRARFGSGVSREVGGVDENWLPEALFGLDFDHQVTEKQKLSIVVDHFPSWADFSDYRLVANFGWEIVINQKGDLSVKFNLIDRYDSTPNGARPNDVDYALVLIWAL